MPTSMIPATSEFWSSDPVYQQTSPIEKVAGLGMNIGLLGGGLYLAKNIRIGESQERTLLDHVQNVVRRTGYASPFSLLNTFRSAEFLSPFVTTGSLQLGLQKSVIDPSKSVVQYKYENRFLSDRTTREALISSFPEIEALGKKSPAYDLGFNHSNLELIFESDPKTNAGSLYINNLKSTEAPQLISDKVSLMEMRSTEITAEGIQPKSKLNPAMKAILQAQGYVDDLEIRATGEGKTADSLLERYGTAKDIEGNLEKKRFGFIKTPGADQAGLTFARAFPAYGMERIKRLLGGVFDQVPVFGKIAEKFDKVYGLGEIRSGTASKMFTRYGLRAAALGATALAVEQLDYYRRNLSLPGDIGISGIFALAGAGAAKKAFSNLTAPKAGALGVGLFAAQMILPGFEQGIMPGIATTAVNLDVATTAIGELTFMNSYRRTVEGLLPGFSSFEMSIFAGATLAGVSGLGSDPISAKIFRRLNNDQKRKLFGEKTNLVTDLEVPFTRKRFQQIGFQQMTEGKFITEAAQNLFGDSFSDVKYSVSPEVQAPRFIENQKVYNNFFNKARSIGGADAIDVLEKELFEQYNAALEKRQQAYSVENPLNTSYYRRVDEIERAAAESGKIKTVFAHIKNKLTHAFFGASFEGAQVIDDAMTSGRKNLLKRFPALFFAGALGHSLFSGSLLGSMETADEKSAIYSGKELVAVKRGRWWEGGGTPFAGRDTMYYRPHAYVQYINRVDEVGVWGPNEDDISPIGKFILKNFTYEMERRNYYNRPFPVTAGAFEDVPVIGNILAATVGQLIKPTKLMHVNDFMRVGPDGEVQYKTQNEIDRPAYSLGGASHGAPVSPFETGKVLTNLQYQFRELEGLTGWAKNMFQKASTGAETFGLDAPVMQSANAMASLNQKFWDMELGGGLLLSEPIRRFLPKDRSQIVNYNPIQNQMPSWLPERFHYGDPYSKVKSGTVRMPGESYATLHPELKGVDPEKYPDIYKYKILADIAPTSREFKQVRESMYKRRASGTLSQKEIQLMDQADKLLNEKISYQNFDVDPNAYNIPIASKVSRALYGGGIDLFKDTIAPIEYMVPMGFRPTQKLLNYSNPIDQYEYQRLYGTMFSFWDKPIRDWFRPAIYTAAHAMGYTGTPQYRQNANSVNEYFDKLQFYKEMQLAQNAENTYQRNLHLRNAGRTRYGINPNANAMAIYQSLPEGEKEFFDSFASATGRDRKKILSMMPEDQVGLYENLYSRIDSGDRSLYPGGNTKVDEQYLTQKFYELDEYFQDKSLPDQDWVGWHEDANLDDIKVRYVEELGMDLYDVDMYNSKLRAQKRRGYLNGAEQALMQGQTVPGISSLQNLIRNTVNLEDPRYSEVTNVNIMQFGQQNRSFFEINDDRRYEMIRMMQNGYE